jgi:hypothetical protein
LERVPEPEHAGRIAQPVALGQIAGWPERQYFPDRTRPPHDGKIDLWFLRDPNQRHPEHRININAIQHDLFTFNLNIVIQLPDTAALY